MNIKAILPPGQAEITVNGLHQWDYGQKLEIHSNELPAIIEVHFACSGMTEAVVRNCAVVEGVATADIPDRCIEQTTPIVAWVYYIGETSGRTEHTIIMPIIARTKPAPAPSIPTAISDKYTELIEAVNEQIGAFSGGNVVAGKATEAEHATTADSATEAEHATTADRATEAEYATTADSATEAEHATTADSASYITPTSSPPDVYEKAQDETGFHQVYLQDDTLYLVKFVMKFTENESQTIVRAYGILNYNFDVSYDTNSMLCSLGGGMYLKLSYSKDGYTFDNGLIPAGGPPLTGEIYLHDHTSPITSAYTVTFYKIGGGISE